MAAMAPAPAWVKATSAALGGLKRSVARERKVEERLFALAPFSARNRDVTGTVTEAGDRVQPVDGRGELVVGGAEISGLGGNLAAGPVRGAGIEPPLVNRM
jgi:hypothetical protein